MKLDLKNRLEPLREEYMIDCISHNPIAEWPLDKKTIFQAVQDLSRHTFDKYGKDDDGVSQEMEWVNNNKNLAKRLVQKSKLCRARNEATWRFECESIVFTRLDAEVACPNCRNRVWRSEIEVVPATTGRSGESLRRRQKDRRPCHCHPSSRFKNNAETGLSKIFINRAQERVIDDPKLAAQLGTVLQPDRIYGLQQTNNLENLLNERQENGIRVRDLVSKGPVSEDNAQLLFPFLVVEAKSDTSKDDWDSTKLQTSFPIYTFLRTQQSIKTAAGRRTQWQQGPLVWFFLNKGKDWKVCLAYQTYTTSGIEKTHIQEVWNGCIDVLNDALQLILIVGYMVDWARDSYRPAILKELQIIATPDNFEVMSIITDSDIYSTENFNRVDSQLERFGQGNIEPTESATDIINQFRALDSIGAVRSAIPIESRFSCLFITRDNIQTMRRALPLQFIFNSMWQILAGLAAKAVAIQSEYIHAIEKEWTGHHRTSSPSTNGKKFYSIITVLFYMSPSWDQIRELAVISIEENVFELLVTGSKREFERTKVHAPSGGNIVGCVRRLKNRSIRQNLFSSIHRDAYYVSGFDHDILGLSTDCGQILEQKDDGASWDLVNRVYKYCQVGRLEPDLPFLKISSRIKVQSQSLDKPTPDSSLHHWPDNLQVSHHQAVLVHSENSYLDTSTVPTLCVFLLTSPTELPDKSSVAEAIKGTIEDLDVYHTTRNNEQRASLREIRNECHRVPWNITNTYGIYFSNEGKFGASVDQWLISLESSPPRRFGSPRGPSLHGNIFERRKVTWKDPRVKNREDQNYGRARHRHITNLAVLEFVVWGGISRDRRSRGESCCQACARKLMLRVESPRDCDICRVFCDVCKHHLGCQSSSPVPLALWKIALQIINTVSLEGSFDEKVVKLEDAFYARLNSKSPINIEEVKDDDYDRSDSESSQFITARRKTSSGDNTKEIAMKSNLPSDNTASKLRLINKKRKASVDDTTNIRKFVKLENAEN